MHAVPLKSLLPHLACAALCLLPMVANAAAPAAKAPETSGPACEGFGPQTPRDIDQRAGSNAQVFKLAPGYKQMNLCNLHFHSQAEHKAADYAVPSSEGAAGFQCQMSKRLTAAELKAPEGDVCKGLKPGDTVEVHWVHSSCQVKPGAGLGSCLSDKCANPDLRVEAQVFTLVNDAKAPQFSDYAEVTEVNGRYQARMIPANTGKPAVFAGSTTGPKYTEQACSPLQVTWSVRPKCAKLDINSLAAWCKKNEFAEDHAHGVRKLVVNPKLLSPIQN